MVDLKSLQGKKCKPCEKGVPPFSKEEAELYVRALPDWHLASDGKTIVRDFLMKDFLSAVDLIQRIAQIAEAEDHHPDVHLTGYRKLRIELGTHSIGGLSENDFILAAKIDPLPKALK
ncbi:MAG: pterin-4-alpha-carbinolamine dehydratase [Omnitrophica bacterium RIFCSPLOWO2_01_FULL_50_24]|nr:MAG: pterin-4-alpha-carbinolamine dehydratase [Omnitrophica bacterium RIFCSPLOWO2_01_FULL_50_24]